MNWYALYTKPRNEKKVAQQLASIGIEVFCPMVTKVKRWSDRNKKVQEPLLPSYVFIRIQEKNRNEVFQIQGVVRYVFWLGKPAIVNPNEIEALKLQLTQANPIVSIQVATLAVNDAISIDTGPFKGISGIVKHISGTTVKLALPSLNLSLIIQRA